MDNISISGAKIYFYLFGVPITETQINSLIVTALLFGLCLFLTHGLKVRPTSKRQLVAEWIVEKVTNLVRDNMGERFLGFVPFVAAILGLSACSSLLALVAMYPPTADLNTVLGWALLVFVMITYYKIRANGPLGYLKGFTEPIFVFTPFNILGEIATPVSMAFRHFGNIAGGGVITGILYTALSMFSAIVLKLIASGGWIAGAVLALIGILLLALGLKKHKKGRTILGAVSLLVGAFGILQALGLLSGVPVLALGIPAVLSLYFDLFSAFVQALVFSLLTMVYIAGSCPAQD